MLSPRTFRFALLHTINLTKWGFGSLFFILFFFFSFLHRACQSVMMSRKESMDEKDKTEEIRHEELREETTKTEFSL